MKCELRYYFLEFVDLVYSWVFLYSDQNFGMNSYSLQILFMFILYTFIHVYTCWLDRTRHSSRVYVLNWRIKKKHKLNNIIESTVTLKVYPIERHT